MSLHAEIPTFAAVLDALTGCGEELHIEAKKTQLIFWSVNLAMTSQALFRISPRFFGRYQLHRPVEVVDGRSVKQDSVRSRILLKTVRAIFRKNTNMLQTLEQCHLDHSLDKSHLQLKLVATDGATKTHSLWYGETDPAKALYSKETQHRFTIDPGYFIDYLLCFHPRVTDVAIECTPDAVKLKSYWGDAVPANDRPMYSEFTINSCDFASYVIRRNVQLAFGLKEFKTALSYASETRGLISAYFDEPGKPIVFSAEIPGAIIADFALVTKAEESVPTQISANHSGISYGSRAGYR